MKTRWIGPLGLAQRDADRLHDRLCAMAGALPAPAWPVVGVSAGCLPLLAAYGIGSARWAWPAAIGLAALLVLAAADRRPVLGIAAVGAGMFAHCALAIALTWSDPAGMDVVLTDGAAYWEKTLRWVQTGESPEYTLSWWVPAHVQLIAATTLLSYISLGITALHEGFYEVGLMNYYVGSLLREANDPVTALLVGWHPWSVARGIGFLLLCQEVVDWSLARLLGRTLATARVRLTRWGLALGFLAVDAGLKLWLLEPIRMAIRGAL